MVEWGWGGVSILRLVGLVRVMVVCGLVGLDLLVGQFPCVVLLPLRREEAELQDDLSDER